MVESSHSLIHRLNSRVGSLELGKLVYTSDDNKSKIQKFKDSHWLVTKTNIVEVLAGSLQVCCYGGTVSSLLITLLDYYIKNFLPSLEDDIKRYQLEGVPKNPNFP